MIKVYLKAKTFEELILKQEVMNKLSGKEFQYNESFYAKSEFYVTYKDGYERWKRMSAIVEERFKKPKKKTETKAKAKVKKEVQELKE